MLNRRNAVIGSVVTCLTAVFTAPSFAKGAKGSECPPGNPKHSKCKTPTPSSSPIPATQEPLPTATATATAQPTNTPTNTPTSTSTPSATPSSTATPTATPTSAADWTDIGVIDQIAVATTEWGRSISNLTLFNGRIFLGHGDYTMNTPNPCRLLAWSASDGLVDYGTLNSVALLDMNVIGDQLAIPYTDLAVGTYPSAAFLHTDGRIEVIGGGYTPRPWHVYGSALFGGKRYLSGSHFVTSTTDAKGVWRDDAGRWVNSDFTPNSYLGSAGRVYGLFVFNNALYASHAGGALMKTADGQSWSSAGSGPNRMRKPLAHGGSIYFMTGDAGYGLGALYRFDGSVKSVRSSLWDYTVGDDGMLYMLTSDGKILNANQQVTATVPTKARSIAVVSGQMIVGTSDARLLVAPR